jgi:pimeloyl-ACP methyl ester carboxylesterase
MSNYTHQTAPTQFVEAAGIRFAYRRFANRRFGVTIDIPLLFFMHFTGTMDHWDPALTDGFAQDREVILFNNAGVSSSSGGVPTSIEEMAQHAAAFIDALGIKKLDALGFSMGASSHSSSPSTGQTLSENSSSLALAHGVARGWRR